MAVRRAPLRSGSILAILALVLGIIDVIITAVQYVLIGFYGGCFKIYISLFFEIVNYRATVPIESHLVWLSC